MNSETNQRPNEVTIGRLDLLDFSRGAALIAMAVFHFAFDLQLFGFKEPGYIDQPHWKYFARAIASSFLFLVGIGLYLAHFSGVSWDKWRWRMTKIVAAALVITIATYFATPNQFIFFGILHQIAFASFACLIFIRLPAILTLTVAVLVFWAGRSLEFSALDHPVWWWTGLTEITPVSSDYVPVFPWWSASLAGVAAAKIMHSSGTFSYMAKYQMNDGASRLLKFLGRNSLVFYLVHQPVMIGFILAYLFATGQLPN